MKKWISSTNTYRAFGWTDGQNKDIFLWNRLNSNLNAPRTVQYLKMRFVEDYVYVLLFGSIKPSALVILTFHCNRLFMGNGSVIQWTAVSLVVAIFSCVLGESCFFLVFVPFLFGSSLIPRYFSVGSSLVPFRFLAIPLLVPLWHLTASASNLFWRREEKKISTKIIL